MNESMKKAFHLHACCMLVKGARRSTICDLQRMDFEFIPNALYEILTTQRGKSLNEVKENHDTSHHSTIDEYFEFLVSRNFGFWCDTDDLARFPDIELDWERPEKITNALIDVSSASHDFSKISSELSHLGCKALQLRFFCQKPLAEIAEILGCFSKSTIRHIDLILTYNPEINIPDYERLCFENQRIFSVLVHSSPNESLSEFESTLAHIQHTKVVIDSSKHCGKIGPSSFYTNIDLFTESQKHNSCLNRKISVHEHGEIKNCPSMTNSYGNVSSVSLSEAIAAKNFKDAWGISKDQIKTCKDCEFRHVCTDCRAYLEDPQDIFSKPLKCGYDPYTATWSDWASNPLKQKGIRFYGFDSMTA